MSGLIAWCPPHVQNNLHQAEKSWHAMHICCSLTAWKGDAAMQAVQLGCPRACVTLAMLPDRLFTGHGHICPYMT